MRFPAPVTVALMVAVGAAALCQWVLAARAGESVADWAVRWGYVPAHPRAEAVATALLVHTNALHLLANLLGLWLFAYRVEAVWGSVPFALGGVGAQWLALTVQGQIVRRWMPDALNAPLVGASAWVAFAMGAAWVGCPDAAVALGDKVRLPLRWLSGAWLLWQGAMGVGQGLGVVPANAAWAHATAWVTGWLMAWLLGWREWRQRQLQARALAAERQGAWDEAAQWWHAAATLKGTDAAAWLSAARAWLEAGQIEAAETALRRAIVACNWDATARSCVDAVVRHPRAHALAPSLLLALAEHLERLRWWDAALPLFEALGEREAFDRAPYALLRAAALHWRLGQRDRAQHALLRFWLHPAHALWQPLAHQLAAQYRADRLFSARPD